MPNQSIDAHQPIADAFKKTISDYNTIVARITDIATAPQRLAEKQEVCSDCLLRFAVVTEVFLRKIDQTIQTDILTDFLMANHPGLLLERLPKTGGIESDEN